MNKIVDLEEECENFEKKMQEAGGVDLFIGGGRHFEMNQLSKFMLLS